MIRAGGNDYNDREIVSPAPHPASLEHQLKTQQNRYHSQLWLFISTRDITFKKINGGVPVFLCKRSDFACFLSPNMNLHMHCGRVHYKAAVVSICMLRKLRVMWKAWAAVTNSQ